jgi:hypothetical protein
MKQRQSWVLIGHELKAEAEPGIDLPRDKDDAELDNY